METKKKLSKAKKVTFEFGDGNVDNTEPVHKILEHFQIMNNPAFAFYCQTVRPRQKTVQAHHYTYTSHPLYAFPDDWDGDLRSGYFEQLQYKSTVPKMITPMQNIDKSDPVINDLMTKRIWLKKKFSIHQMYKMHKLLEEPYAELNDEVIMCPKELVKFAALLDSDPDIYFNSPYNWYYAGNGNMLLVCINWVDYMLHSEFHTLYLTRFFNQEVTLSTTHAAIFNCEDENNILETICSTNNIAAIRTKNKVVILKIVQEEDTLKFEKIKAIESELPFTGISFDNHHKNILYVTSLSNKVIIVNLDRLTGRTVLLPSKTTSWENNWNTVISSDRATYTHVKKDSITIYDKRTNKIAHRWSDVRRITDFELCNDISVAKQCEGSSSLYFGTDHHLCLMDLRCNSNHKPRVIQRWTHGMKSPPTYMSICNFGYNKELICLSSQWCEDTCVVPNYIEHVRHQNDNIFGVTMPYRLQSLLSTLKEARDKLLCMDLYDPIDPRIKTAITGQVISENGENYIVLVQNSLGDISHCTLYPQHMEFLVNEDSCYSFYEWSKQYKREQKKLEMSAIVDISSMWKSLKKIPSDYEYVFNLDSHVNSKVIEKEIQDAYDKEELDSGLLDIWLQNPNESTKAEDSSSALKLHYSDSYFTDNDNNES